MTAYSADPNWLDGVVLNDENEAFTPWIDIHEFEKFTVFVQATKTSTPGDLTFTLEMSMDSATHLNKATAPDGETLVSGDYDKLITGDGVDAPVASVALSADGVKVFSKSLEDSIRSVRLGYVAASTTDGTKFWTIEAGYSGAPR